MKYALNTSIREYFINEYPDDELGQMLKDITFNDLLIELVRRQDVYETIGAVDSFIREDLFCKLADILQVPYIFIYDIWMLPNSDD